MGSLSVHEILPQLYIAIMTQVFNLLLWIVLEQKGMRLFRSKRPFYNVVMAVFFANLLSAGATFLRYSDVRVPVLLATALQASVYISNTVVTYAFTVFFIHYISAKKGQTGKSPLFNRILLAVLIFAVAGWFVWALPQVRKTGEFLAIEGLLLVFVAWIVVLYYMIFCIAYLVVNRRLLMRRERYVIVVGLVLTIAFTVAQAFAGEVLQINFVGTTLGLYLFYFYFCQDVSAPQAYAERSEAPAAQTVEPVAIKKESVRKRSVSGTVFAIISIMMLVSYVLLGSYLYYRSRTLFLRELQTNDWVNRELQQIVRVTVIACAVCLLVSLLLLFILSRYLKNRFHLLNAKIDVLSYDSDGMKKIDGLSSGDEFEMIADHINEVFEKNIAAQQIEADKLRSAMEVVEQKAEEKLALAEEKLQVAEGRLAQAAYLAGERAVAGPVEAPASSPLQQAQGTALRQVQDTASAGSGEGILPELDDSVTKEEAIRRVREAAPKVIAAYRAFSGMLQPYFEPEGVRETESDLPEIDPEELEELYGAILEFAEMYDEEAIRRLLEQTNGYAVPDSEKERFAHVKECVVNSDWNALKETLGTL